MELADTFASIRQSIAGQPSLTVFHIFDQVFKSEECCTPMYSQDYLQSIPSQQSKRSVKGAPATTVRSLSRERRQRRHSPERLPVSISLSVPQGPYKRAQSRSANNLAIVGLDNCGSAAAGVMAATADEFVRRAKHRGFEGFDFATEGQWKGAFCFVQAADTQLGMIDSYENKNPEPSWDREIELTTQAVDAINRMQPRPRFFVVCGDLVDSMPGVSSKPAQVADLKRVLAKLHPDIRCVCVCGNHDVGDVPTPAAIEQYCRDFGDDYFAFWVGGCKFVVVNSQFYHDSSCVEEQKEKHDAWLDQELRSDASRPRRHLVGFQHIPPFVQHPNEEPVHVPGNDDLKFNIANKALRHAFLKRLKDARMTKLFCGHYHRNAGGWDGELEVIVTSAIGCQLGNDGHGLRVVRVLEQSIAHQYYRLEDIPTKVEL